jgi:hypothetical protein
MPLLPPVIRAFLPLSYIMLTFCRTGIRYDARHASGLMTVIDGGCKNNYALSRTFKRSATQIHPIYWVRLGSKTWPFFTDFKGLIAIRATESMGLRV